MSLAPFTPSSRAISEVFALVVASVVVPVVAVILVVVVADVLVVLVVAVTIALAVVTVDDVATAVAAARVVFVGACVALLIAFDYKLHVSVI